MDLYLQFVVACRVLSLIYGIYATRGVLSCAMGNDQMQEIARAIQEGARAYLNPQYQAISQ